MASTSLCQNSRISLLTRVWNPSSLVPDLVFRWGIMENEWGFFRDGITALEENTARLQIQCRMALKAQYMFTIIQWPLFVYMAVVPRTPRMNKACITAGSVRRRWAHILPFLLMLRIISSEFNWWRRDCCSHWLDNKMTQGFPVPLASPEWTALHSDEGVEASGCSSWRNMEGGWKVLCLDSDPAASSLVTKEPDRTQGSQMNKCL